HRREKDPRGCPNTNGSSRPPCPSPPEIWGDLSGEIGRAVGAPLVGARCAQPQMKRGSHKGCPYGEGPSRCRQYAAGSPLSVGLAITFLKAALIGTLRLMPLGGIGLRNHLS